EELRLPYTLEGAVRWFNQDMLERDEIRDHLLYFCMDRSQWAWRCYDSHSRKLEMIDENYLADRLEELL
ncbi:MAG: hypothetical protein R2762_31055, partial [Bryobacteraceae bacterium]